MTSVLHKKTLLTATAALLLAGSIGTVQAQQSPWYIGASIGQASYDYPFASAAKGMEGNPLYAVASASLNKDTDTGYKLTVGYRALPWLSVEGDYVNLGKITTAYELRTLLDRYTREGTYKTSGFNLSAVAHGEMNATFSAFGRAGLFYSIQKYSETGKNYPGFTPNPAPEDHTFTAPDLKRSEFSFGAGVDAKLSSATTVRLSWDRYRSIGKSFTDPESATDNGKFDNVDLFAVSVLLKF